MSQTAVANNQPKRRMKLARPALPPEPIISTANRSALDALEWLLLFAFYGWFLWQLLSAFRADTSNWSCAVLIVSESTTVLFLLVRHRSRSISCTPGEWGLAAGATLAPLLACPGGESPLALAWLGQAVLLLGTISLLYAKIALGRSIGMIPAHRGLKQSGPYRLVRHPMYACYILCHVGVLLRYPTFWNVCVYALFYGLQVPRLLVEETHLRRDPCYGEYMAEVPYRLIPGLF